MRGEAVAEKFAKPPRRVKAFAECFVMVHTKNPVAPTSSQRDIKCPVLRWHAICREAVVRDREDSVGKLACNLFGCVDRTVTDAHHKLVCDFPKPGENTSDFLLAVYGSDENR